MKLYIWKFIITNRELTNKPDIPGWGKEARIAAIVAETEVAARQALEAFTSEPENSMFSPGWLRFASVEKIEIEPGAFITWVEE